MYCKPSHCTYWVWVPPQRPSAGGSCMRNLISVSSISAPMLCMYVWSHDGLTAGARQDASEQFLSSLNLSFSLSTHTGNAPRSPVALPLLPMLPRLDPPPPAAARLAISNGSAVRQRRRFSLFECFQSVCPEPVLVK
jgi:hypothetical protein